MVHLTAEETSARDEIVPVHVAASLETAGLGILCAVQLYNEIMNRIGARNGIMTVFVWSRSRGERGRARSYRISPRHNF